MKSLLKRLAIAALLSLSCASGTVLWYFNNEEATSAASTALVAQAAQVNNEVLRRAPTRLLWESVSTGDDLFDGETIRTSEKGELRIRFNDGRYIELEPESLVVLQKSENAISLDLLEGSLFVNAQTSEADAESLVLKAENKSLDLTGASAKLSRGMNNRLDIEVHEGSAHIQDAAGVSREIKSGEQSALGTKVSSRIEILSPPTKKPVVLHSSQANKVTFRWKGLDSAWKVEVLAGPTRTRLTPIAENDEVHPDTAIAALPLGKSWWRLVARSRSSGEIMRESPTYRLDLRGRAPAVLIAPENDTVVWAEKPPAAVEFKWQYPPGTSRVQLIVSTDPQLATPVFAKEIAGEKSLISPELAEGIYFARLAAFYPELPEPEMSPRLKFTVRRREVLAKPQARISWTVPQAKRQQFFGKTPQLELSWKPEAREDEITGYRLSLKRLSEEATPEENPVRLSLRELATTTPLAQPGRYLASVEAVDEYDHVVGQSEPLEVMSTEAPLLDAPVLLPDTDPLRAGSNGDIELKWRDVADADEYELIVVNKSGREVVSQRLKKNSLPLRGLMPGSYSVKVEAYDRWGRASVPTKPRALLVPDKSGLKAPTLKRIKVD